MIYKGAFIVGIVLLFYNLDLSFAQSDMLVQSDIQSQIDKELNDPSNKILDKAIVLIYSDTSWSGSIMDSSFDSATQDGDGNSKIIIQCNNDGFYSLAIQKQTDHGYLSVSVIQDGKVLDSKATSGQYGVVSLAGNCASSGLGPGLFS